MRYIEIICGPHTLYIDEEELEAIIENPSVYRVPGQPSGVAGISYYREKLVVYYYPLGWEKTPHKTYRCGIIIRDKNGYRGILSDEVGEGRAVPEELEQVMQGVWVKKRD